MVFHTQQLYEIAWLLYIIAVVISVVCGYLIMSFMPRLIKEPLLVTISAILLTSMQIKDSWKVPNIASIAINISAKNSQQAKIESQPILDNIIFCLVVWFLFYTLTVLFGRLIIPRAKQYLVSKFLHSPDEQQNNEVNDEDINNFEDIEDIYQVPEYNNTIAETYIKTKEEEEFEEELDDMISNMEMERIKI